MLIIKKKTVRRNNLPWIYWWIGNTYNTCIILDNNWQIIIIT